MVGDSEGRGRQSTYRVSGQAALYSKILSPREKKWVVIQQKEISISFVKIRSLYWSKDMMTSISDSVVNSEY